MNNRLDLYARTVVTGVFTDFQHLWSKRGEWVRDLSRLLAQLSSRGISLMTLDLPPVDKHLNRCLAEGTFTRSGLVLMRPRKGEQIPIFLREVFLRIFLPDGKLVGRPCPDSIIFVKTLTSLFKKIELECEQRYIDEEIRNFRVTDAALPDPSLNWDRDELGVWSGDRTSVTSSTFGYRSKCSKPDKGEILLSRAIEYAQRCFDIVASSIGQSPSLRWGDPDNRCKPKHGPGAVANLSRTESKYRFPNWPNKLQSRFPFDAFALPGFGQGFSAEGHFEYTEEEPPAKLIAVPKDLRKPRLIASEPVENQWIQQYIAGVLISEFDKPVFGNSITLADQTGNQKRALDGSIDGLSATIDLSEASDRLSLRLLECVFGANIDWLLDLHSSRSKFIDLGKNDLIELRKFAPQGNACTFPVQSLVFYCLAQASVHSVRNILPSSRSLNKSSRDIGVYGDDIIVPSDTAETLAGLMSYFGLKVNESKSFWNGKFRESCGIEAFMGYDVTPARLKAIPAGLASVPSLVETSNSFYKKGLWYSSDAISQFFKEWKYLIPIRKEADVPISMLSFQGNAKLSRGRTNPQLQRREHKILCISQKKRNIEMEARERIMQYFTENPDPESDWASGTTSQGLKVVIRPMWKYLPL